MIKYCGAAIFGQITLQAIAVVGFVADHSYRDGIEEAVPEDSFDELAFVWRSALDTNGKRKTVIIGETMIFVPLPRLVGPTASPLFWPPLKEASIKASPSSSFPRACSSSQPAQDAFEPALPHPLLETAVAGQVGALSCCMLAVITSKLVGYANPLPVFVST